MGVRKFFQACAVAVKAGAVSFRDYLDHEVDPLTRDMLTKVFNRPQFERRRKGLTTYSLVLLDIDNFKHINDCYGHSQGDVVLRAVAAVLRTSSGDRVFRVGGEEFAVLLANCTAEDAVKVAERLVATVRNLEILEGHPVTISAGVAWCGQPTDHDAVYRRADQALYRAKSTGKNRVARFEQPARAATLAAASPTPSGGLAAAPAPAPIPAASPLAALSASRN